MDCQDIEHEVVDYIRNSGERVVGYDVDAIVDCGLFSTAVVEDAFTAGKID